MLDLLFCIPIMVGCSTKIKPEGDLTPRICPRCHNASVQSAKSRRWFELCFVPLIPMKSNRVWVCAVCQWMMPIQQGYQPEVPGENYHASQPQGYTSPPPNMYPPGYDGGFQPGYQPQYAQYPNPNAKSN
ncbi:hypothetical protein EIP86_000483 [Pleurotus ostreatoroseus]|nr:hypothetical protein EIP86_000483 [Pleurotus ostreatoroseus]